MPNFTMNFATHEQLAEAHAAARAARKSLGQHLRDLVSGGPAALFAAASGGQLDETTARYALEVAGNLAGAEDGQWRGTAVCDWLSDADRLVGWCRYTPYSDAAPQRVMDWWQSMPDEVRASMRKAVA